MEGRYACSAAIKFLHAVFQRSRLLHNCNGVPEWLNVLVHNGVPEWLNVLVHNGVPEWLNLLVHKCKNHSIE